jgi:hypothetical protein
MGALIVNTSWEGVMKLMDLAEKWWRCCSKPRGVAANHGVPQQTTRCRMRLPTCCSLRTCCGCRTQAAPRAQRPQSQQPNATVKATQCDSQLSVVYVKFIMQLSDFSAACHILFTIKHCPRRLRYPKILCTKNKNFTLH